MSTRLDFRKTICATLTGCALVLACWKAYGLGGNHPNNLPVRSNGNWPEGMADLVNTNDRVSGYWVNDGDFFFFSGSATNFTRFLRAYSNIQGIVDKHTLVLHEGVGAAKSAYGEKTGLSCDWELHGIGNGWKAGVITNYVLEVHFWTGGKFSLSDVSIPENIEVKKGK